jgi:hypothetical protein
MKRLPSQKNLGRFQAPLYSQAFSQARSDEHLNNSVVHDGFSSFRNELHDMFDKLGDISKRNTLVLIDTFTDIQKKEFSKAAEEIESYNQGFTKNLQDVITKIEPRDEILNLKNLIQSVSEQKKNNSIKIMNDIKDIAKKITMLNLNPSKRKSSPVCNKKFKRT